MNNKVQVKVNLLLCLTKYHAMKTDPVLNYHPMKAYWGNGGMEALDGGEFSYISGCFAPVKEPPCTLYRKLGGPQSLSICGGEEKISHHCPCLELDPGGPARSIVTILTELPRLAPLNNKSGFI